MTVTEMGDRRRNLSLLWTFAIFNYVYADILTLYFGSGLQPAAWQHLLTGQVGSRHITQGIALLGAVVLETAVVMVLASRLLPYRANRWANVVVAVIQAASVAMSLPDPLYANLFYWFFAVVEIACSVIIVWYAWTWRPSRQMTAQPGG